MQVESGLNLGLTCRKVHGLNPDCCHRDMFSSVSNGIKFCKCIGIVASPRFVAQDETHLSPTKSTSLVYSWSNVYLEAIG